jgi:hypothetical protein
MSKYPLFMDSNAARGLGQDAVAQALSGDVTLDDSGVATIPAGTVTQAKIAVASLDGTVAKVLAEGSVIGGIPVTHIIDVPDAASGDVDTVLTHKTRVTDVRVVKTAGAGAASNTIIVKNGATAITDTLDMNVADKVVVRAGTIDDASWEIAAAGTLRVSRAKSGGNAACKVIVTGVRVA